jgi:hypothetical protein
MRQQDPMLQRKIFPEKFSSFAAKPAISKLLQRACFSVSGNYI